MTFTEIDIAIALIGRLKVDFKSLDFASHPPYHSSKLGKCFGNECSPDITGSIGFRWVVRCEVICSDLFAKEGDSLMVIGMVKRLLQRLQTAVCFAGAKTMAIANARKVVFIAGARYVRSLKAEGIAVAIGNLEM